MTDVTSMTALEIGDPMRMLVLMESDYGALHQLQSRQ
jgi:hypothetical protein